MRSPRTAPPAPQLRLSLPANSSSSAAGSGNPVITVTPLPPRPATSRATRIFGGPLLVAGFTTGWRTGLDITTPRKVCVGFTAGLDQLLDALLAPHQPVVRDLQYQHGEERGGVGHPHAISADACAH